MRMTAFPNPRALPLSLLVLLTLLSASIFSSKALPSRIPSSDGGGQGNNLDGQKLDGPYLTIRTLFTESSSKNIQELQNPTNSLESDLIATEGKALYVECVLENAPTYDDFLVQWYREGNSTPITSFGERVWTDFKAEKSHESAQRTLTFFPILDSDEGSYVCQANLGVSDLKKEVKIRILGDPHFKTEAGKIGAPIGSSLTIDCNAAGLNPRNSYVNIVDGHGRSINDTQNSGVVVAGYQLTIENVKKEHQGMKIVCLAVQYVKFDDKIDPGFKAEVKGSQAKVDTQPRLYTVTTRNEIIVDVWYPPQFLTPEVKRYALKGQNFTLNCIVVTSNPPVVQLDLKKDGQSVTADQQHQLIHSKRDGSKIFKILLVNNDDFGTYTCEAHNGKLRSSQTILLYEARRPKQPKVEPFSLANDSVTWRITDQLEDGYLPVQLYKVSYKLLGHGHMFPRTLDKDEIKDGNLFNYSGDTDGHEQLESSQELPKTPTALYVFAGLEPFAHYEFEFIAHSESGDSDPITYTVTPGSTPQAHSASNGNGVARNGLLIHLMTAVSFLTVLLVKFL